MLAESHIVWRNSTNSCQAEMEMKMKNTHIHLWKRQMRLLRQGSVVWCCDVVTAYIAIILYVLSTQASFPSILDIAIFIYIAFVDRKCKLIYRIKSKMVAKWKSNEHSEPQIGDESNQIYTMYDERIFGIFRIDLMVVTIWYCCWIVNITKAHTHTQTDVYVCMNHEWNWHILDFDTCAMCTHI